MISIIIFFFLLTLNKINSQNEILKLRTREPSNILLVNCRMHTKRIEPACIINSGFIWKFHWKRKFSYKNYNEENILHINFFYFSQCSIWNFIKLIHILHKKHTPIIIICNLLFILLNFICFSEEFPQKHF